MDRLEQKHINFLKVCASSPNRIHKLPEDVSEDDADQMVNEGLLIKYNRPIMAQYCIARGGAQLAASYGRSDTPEMKDLAKKYVMSKGYEEEDADKIVEEHGVDSILKTQAEEMRSGGQREIQLPKDEMGNPVFKPMRS